MWEEAGRAYTGRSKKVFYLGNGGIAPATSAFMSVIFGDVS